VASLASPIVAVACRQHWNIEEEPTLPIAATNGIKIAYATHGEPSAPPLLVIHGLGAQMIDFPPGLVDGLVGAGFHVITFDNRDQGESTWFDDAGQPDIAALLGDPLTPVPYLLADMAADAAGLLDALGFDSAHILGVSMGGMIAQQFAIDYPDQVRTLTSIMSTPGPTIGPPTPEAVAALLVAPVTERDAAIEQSLAGSRVIASPGFPFDEAGMRTRAEIHFDRGHHPVGTARQLAAVLASPDRTEALGQVTAPTLVVHGAADPLVTLPGGEATAAAIPGAELWVVEGMGHDLPAAVIPELCTRQGTLLTRIS
jgi:pimeloyl-ACP methyl ester carboxylesterase